MPSITVRKNGGSLVSGAIDCTWEDEIRLRLDSTVGVRSVRFEIYGYPDGWTAPTGWTEDATSRVIYAEVLEPDDFTLPTALSNRWGKWLLRVLVNGATADDTSALEIVSTTISLHATPAGEGAQFGGAAESWAKDLEANWRIIENAIAAGGGGGITESQLRTAAAALTASLDVNAQKITDLATPTAATDAATKGYVDGQITDLVYDEGGTAGGRVYTTLAAAVTAAASIPGRVRIWIRTTSGTPTTTGVTYALANRIELCGLQSTQRTTLAMVASAVFQDACAFRNLDIETDLAAAWLTSTGSGLSVALDNTQIVDNGGTAAVATLPGGSTNYLTFDNGSAFNNGGTMPFCTLVAGQTVFLYVRDGQVSDNAITGTAGNLYVYEGGSGNYTVQSGFSGSVVAYQQDVVSQLGRAATAVSVNGQRVTSVAAPTASTDAAPRGWVDGSASVALGSTSVSLTAANVATGHVTLTGALSGNTTATLPTGARAVWLTNATTGTYALCIAGFAGGFCYLLPGQTKRLIQDASGVLRGEGLGVLEVSHTLSLVGISGGDTLHSYRLPTGTTLERCEIVGLVDPNGDGDYSASAGFAADLGEDYSDVVSFAGTPAAGVVRGLASADWGAAFVDGYSYSASERTLVFRLNAFNQTVAPTVGKLRIHVVARYLGE